MIAAKDHEKRLYNQTKCQNCAKITNSHRFLPKVMNSRQFHTKIQRFARKTKQRRSFEYPKKSQFWSLCGSISSPFVLYCLFRPYFYALTLKSDHLKILSGVPSETNVQNYFSGNCQFFALNVGLSVH